MEIYIPRNSCFLGSNGFVVEIDITGNYCFLIFKLRLPCELASGPKNSTICTDVSLINGRQWGCPGAGTFSTFSTVLPRQYESGFKKAPDFTNHSLHLLQILHPSPKPSKFAKASHRTIFFERFLYTCSQKCNILFYIHVIEIFLTIKG